MISAYTHHHIKNTEDTDLQLQTVTLILGGNRSSKSAVLEGLALAATGRSSLGGSRVQGRLLSKGSGSGFARIFFANQTTGGWNIKKKGDGYSTQHVISDAAGNELKPDAIFGDFLYIDDFWKLTGEEKWQAIGRLLNAAIPDEDRQRLIDLSDKAGQALSGDAIADLSAIADKLAAQTKSLKAKRADVINALTPPDEYTGQPLSVMQPRKSQLEADIASQRRSRMLRDNQLRADQQRAAKLAPLQESLARNQGELTKAQANLEEGQGVLAAIVPQAAALRREIEHDNAITTACRSKSVRDVLSDTMSQTSKAIGDCMAMLKRHVVDFPLQGEVNLCAENLNRLSFLVQSCGDTCIDAQIPPPDAVVEIDRLLDFACLGSFRPTSFAGYAHIDSVIGEYVQCLHGSVHKVEEGIAQVQQQIDKLTAEQSTADAGVASLWDDAQLEAVTAELHALNKEIAKANAWTSFLERQKQAVQAIDQIDANIAQSEAIEGNARKLRGEMLSASITPIELSANEFLRTMDIGLLPLTIKIQSTGKRPVLTIETITGIDFAAMSGAEKIFYGTALVSAMQQLSPARSPLLLIEAAEVDSDGMTALLAALSVRIIKGNVVLAHWCAPSCVPPSVEVIDRQLATAGA